MLLKIFLATNQIHVVLTDTQFNGFNESSQTLETYAVPHLHELIESIPNEPNFSAI